jgi:hypothetical protein
MIHQVKIQEVSFEKASKQSSEEVQITQEVEEEQEQEGEEEQEVQIEDSTERGIHPITSSSRSIHFRTNARNYFT